MRTRSLTPLQRNADVPSSGRQSPDLRLSTYTIISRVLQGGVALSTLLLLLGVLVLLIRPGGFSVAQLLDVPHTFAQVGQGLRMLRPQAIIASGLLLLVATPLVRVAVSMITFAREGDRFYTIITCVVLALLLCSLFVLGHFTASQQRPTSAAFSFSLPVFGLMFLGSLLAGLLGALVGLGGGILIVPLLTLVFRLPITFAIGTSIIAVIATSSGAAAAYVRDHLTNMRVGMFLELATTIGAMSGALCVGLFAPGVLSVIFGMALFLSVAPTVLKIGEELPQGVTNDRWASRLRLASSYPDRRLGQDVAYQVTHTPLGFAMMYLAGLLSGLLGIGSGTLKVLALDTLMKLPLKVSTTTSNFMIGVTAAASAGMYFSRSDIPPLVAAPVAIGVLAGALPGAWLLTRLSNRTLRWIFLPVIVVSALEMILHGLGSGPF